MWCSFTLAGALVWSVAQPSSGLQITNARLTVGELGGTRPDARVLPGDILFVAYDIDGLTIDPQGIAKYLMALEVSNAAGKEVLKLEPRDIGDFAVLRGNKMPARTFVAVGPDQEAGNYTCKITVTDQANKASTILTQKFEVLKKDFGIVAVNTCYDDRQLISAPPTGQVGQKLFVHFVVVGFGRDAKTKQPNVEFEFQAVDDKGQPTLPQPTKDRADFAGIKEEDLAFAHWPPYEVLMNRPGKFTLKIKATDKVTNRVTTYEMPLTVQSGK